MSSALNRNFYFVIFYSGLLLVSTQTLANPCNEGIGGTGNTTSNEGLGGTGIAAQDGLGGTGIKAETEGLGGTGIVGVITGFASVCVNGVEAHFDSSTQVDVDGAASSIDKLNIGELVAIDAKGFGAVVTAQRISVIHAIVGRIDSIDKAQNQIKIMDQTVQISAVTQRANNLKVGQTVAVSGLVNASGIVQAVRTDVVSAATPATVTGWFANSRISGVPVTVTGKTPSSTNVQASGKWDGKTLTVVDVKQNAMDRVMHAGYAFDVQGIASYDGNSKTLYALGKPVYVDANTKVYGDKNLNGTTAIVRGRVDGEGRAVAKTVEYRPIDKMLERGGSKERPMQKLDYSKSNKTLTESKKQQFKLEKQDDKALDKLDANEKPEKVDTSDKIEKLEKVEKLDKVEKAEKIEKPQKIEVPERVETPERPNKHGY